MGYNPQESLENTIHTIHTMNTLSGIHSTAKIWGGSSIHLVDGPEIRDSPVEQKVVEIPLFIGFFLHLR